jgi:hypothetical protein
LIFDSQSKFYNTTTQSYPQTSCYQNQNQKHLIMWKMEIHD